jgi:hypothetical protein
MLFTILDDLIFYQIIRFRKKFSNEEIRLFKYFYKKMRVYPENIIIIRNFMFIFVKNEDYFKASKNLKYIRRQLLNKKILIIRAENTFINLLISLFPDLYVHKIAIEMNFFTGKRHISVGFLSYEDRAIAIGCNGDYIKCVNYMLENYVIFENGKPPLTIRCEVIPLTIGCNL